MSRPIKWRKVEFLPKNTYFFPLGKRKCELEEIVLKIEELEAMRLKDIEGLTQEECAKRMEISRQTFQNVIDKARKKVAIALTKGMAISINGGNYTRNICSFKCTNCGSFYEINFEGDKDVCPKCGSEKVMCIKKNNFCNKRCNKSCY
ncbi:hypothetical protein CLOACE_06040 [Clostridium acetireducens DSM 10703]|uniref:UPF0251 protein CLOACE_06040 n=1 Tax=Clostridium acetireducens DSM 10703 TaxID=1121290 RepID=A0A1E8F0S8_9CLOT|nr:DUF134 domain-containing protein [Clostridium acetireducens]OFI07018.1 hypothetical protein CLOACE_06040 [Clostridium acetireducens DSM 10703]